MSEAAESSRILPPSASKIFFAVTGKDLGLPWLLISASLLLLLGVTARHFWFRDPRLNHLPPKVPGLPIINQTFYHMQDNLATNAIKWTSEFGEIYRTRTGTTDWIWLNSGEAVKELVDRKSSIYSSRLISPMGFEAASGGRRVVFMPRCKQWRTIRGIIHKLLTPKAAKSYAPIQTYEAKQLSVDLLNTPGDFYMHNRRYSASLILQITYGRRIPKFECEEIRKIFEVLIRFGQTRRPGQWLVDSFPPLANMPLFDLVSDWRRFGHECFLKDSEVWMEFWTQMRREIDAGTAPHSFGKGFVQSDWAKKGLDELQAAYVLGTMIEAGSESTSLQLNNTLVGVLSRGRTVLEAAHEELDRVVGSERTPTFEDEKDLPYIRAMVKEVNRWRFVNKFGSNHYAMEDGWYKGYFIPKGSVVMINVWGLQRDPKRFPDPETYEPMRFYNHTLSAAESAAASDYNLRDHWTYGGGRRICPGMHVAERSLFLNIARLMWGFDISHAKDENGIDIPVDTTFGGMVPGASAAPLPFKCDIRVRSPKHEKILRQEWDEAQIKGMELKDITFEGFEEDAKY